MSLKNHVSRRQFLSITAAAGVATPLFLPGVGRGQDRSAPSERIAVGFIGVGMMGRGHLGSFLGQKDVEVRAICEIEKTRRENAQKQVESRYAAAKKSGQYKGCDVCTDFRELIARDDIDAVVIATPDHGHVIPVLWAANAKKDIYCEKPLTHNVREGRLITEAVAKNDIIFQTGSQQRSEFRNHFRRAVEYIWSGRIGKLKTVRIGVGAPAIPCDLPEEEAPDDVVWDQWIGPAPWRGYNEVLCPKGMHRHFPAFRRYREYTSGPLADMGAHHFDIAQWAMKMDESGPVKVEAPEGDAVSGLKFTYASGVEMFHGGPSGCTFEGTDGTIYVDRPKITASKPEIINEPLARNDERVYPSSNHRRNWLDCVKARKQTICPPETGHRTATICHLANIGYRLRRPLQWDPKAEKFVNDTEADALLVREPRDGWSYEKVS